jgi:hypothetical protein
MRYLLTMRQESGVTAAGYGLSGPEESQRISEHAIYFQRKSRGLGGTL